LQILKKQAQETLFPPKRSGTPRLPFITQVNGKTRSIGQGLNIATHPILAVGLRRRETIPEFPHI